MSNLNRTYIYIVGILLFVGILILGYSYMNNEGDFTFGGKSKSPNSEYKHAPKPLAFEIQELVKLQQEKGTRAIMDINCGLIELFPARDYCESQQEMIRSWNK